MNSKKKKVSQKNSKSSFAHIFFSTLFKTLFIASCIALIAMIGILGGTLYGYIDATQELNVTDLNLDFTSFVYYKNSETEEYVELERLYAEENRVWVDMNQIPEHLKHAFIAIEDERFERHMGFDYRRTIGATIGYISNKIIGRSHSYGGSTITQQLIKNITGEDDVSVQRKIQEIWRAILLEKQLSKEQILELYLNTIHLGEGCDGVQAASNMYFSKDVSELTLPEAASIAGITQYPVKYNPFLNPENNKEKQETVLSKMFELGYISKDEYTQAKDEPLNFEKESQQRASSKQSYFVDQVIEDVLNDLQHEKGYSEIMASKLLFTGGFQIYSTIDPEVQNALDKVFSDENNFPPSSGEEHPEAAMIVLDPYTGQIKGIVGGRGKKTAARTLNRATQTIRQPGSSIKPIGVYAPAIEYGIVTPGTVIDDVPTRIGNWSPRNWYNSYWGLSTVRRGVEQSMNILAVKTLDMVGVNRSFNFLKNNLSITTLVESTTRNGKVYSDKVHNALSLGGLTDGISVLEMAAAYAPFPNKGVYNEPYTYTKVIDRNGNVLLEKEMEIDSHIAMSEETAFLMTQLLSSAVNSGTGSGARLASGITAAGKTGTTSDDKDRWFVGYTPYYVGATWFGYDDPKPMTRLLSGRPNPAIVLWKAVMNEVHKGKAAKNFTQPSNIVKVQICIDSGHKPSDLCVNDPRGSRVRTEYFKKGTEPTQTCSVHVTEEVCADTFLLPSQYCPANNVIQRIFIKRPTPYNPNGPIPQDALYELPTEECDFHNPNKNINNDDDTEDDTNEEISNATDKEDDKKDLDDE